MDSRAAVATARSAMAAPLPELASGFLHVPGPLHVEVCDFGQGQGSTFDGLVVFGGADPNPLPRDVRAALAGHIQAGRRIVVMTHTENGMAWVKGQIAVLTAPGGRA